VRNIFEQVFFSHPLTRTECEGFCLITLRVPDLEERKTYFHRYLSTIFLSRVQPRLRPSPIRRLGLETMNYKQRTRFSREEIGLIWPLLFPDRENDFFRTRKSKTICSFEEGLTIFCIYWCGQTIVEIQHFVRRSAGAISEIINYIGVSLADKWGQFIQAWPVGLDFSSEIDRMSTLRRRERSWFSELSIPDGCLKSFIFSMTSTHQSKRR
jgi:hypothetical protein